MCSRERVYGSSSTSGSAKSSRARSREARAGVDVSLLSGSERPLAMSLGVYREVLKPGDSHYNFCLVAVSRREKRGFPHRVGCLCDSVPIGPSVRVSGNSQTSLTRRYASAVFEAPESPGSQGVRGFAFLHPIASGRVLAVVEVPVHIVRCVAEGGLWSWHQAFWGMPAENGLSRGSAQSATRTSCSFVGCRRTLSSKRRGRLSQKNACLLALCPCRGMSPADANIM